MSRVRFTGLDLGTANSKGRKSSQNLFSGVRVHLFRLHQLDSISKKNRWHTLDDNLPEVHQRRLRTLRFYTFQFGNETWCGPHSMMTCDPFRPTRFIRKNA